MRDATVVAILSLCRGNSRPDRGIQSWIRDVCVVIPIPRGSLRGFRSNTPAAPHSVIWCVGLYGCERSAQECGRA